MNKTIRNIQIALLLCCTHAQAQDILIDSCGMDDSPVLNQYEIHYFRKAIGSHHIDNPEDLRSKRVLFLTDNYGASHRSKSVFFNQDCKPWLENNDYPGLQLIMLTAEEQSKVGDYDAIIISWSKIPVSDRTRKKFIKNGRKHVENNNKYQ